jgi:hypothetical protein
MIRSYIVAEPGEGIRFQCAFCALKSVPLQGVFSLGMVAMQSGTFEKVHGACEARERAKAIGRTFVAQAATTAMLRRVSRETK